MSEPKLVLSLGAGVQSSTLLLMSCLGELPKLDCAVFADTGWETKATYRHLEWLIEYARGCGIQVHRIQAKGRGGIPASVRENADFVP